MGNYVSRQAQLESELKFMFNRLMSKKTIEKKHIMSIVNKFKNLERENSKQFKTIANKANSLNSTFKQLSFKGRIVPKEWDKLNLIYNEFQEITKEKIT